MSKIRAFSNKRVILILIMQTFCTLGCSNAAGLSKEQLFPDQAEWQLIWQDEFNSGEKPQYPDPNNWGYETGYVRNREWQYYTKKLQNAYCKNGLLHIEAHKHPPGTYPKGKHPHQNGSISSASLTTRNKAEHKYGLLRMRAKIETRPGTWGAWWTLGTNGPWPDNGECNIYEFYQGKLLFNIAWWKQGDKKYKPRWDSVKLPLKNLPPDWPEKFHIWTMLWNEKQVKLYLDGTLYNTWQTKKDTGDNSIKGFRQPHYMIINQAIGGKSGGNPKDLKYPTSYKIDYIRWYQKTQKKEMSFLNYSVVPELKNI